MCPRQLIRNDAPLERDADALVGILLEGGSIDEQLTFVMRGYDA